MAFPQVSSLGAGQGTLVFRATPSADPHTSVETVRAESPLKLLTPKNHGSFAWVYTANFGGGLVDGDHLGLHVHVHAKASALLATQSSTKVYRSPNGCRQTLDATVEESATLVALPDPVCCFDGARYEQRNDIRLAKTASLVLLDSFSCGRSARGERWAFSRYASRTRIFREGPVVIDATLLDPAHGDLQERMGRFDALATLIILGPRFRALGALVRIAGVSVEKVMGAVRTALGHLPETLGDDPFARKW
jgi:urease accessory protein